MMRDCVRRAAFGANFLVAGIENQETIGVLYSVLWPRALGWAPNPS